MSVDDFDSSFATSAVSPTDVAGIRFDSDDYLPQVGPPRWDGVFVLWVYRFNGGDLQSGTASLIVELMLDQAAIVSGIPDIEHPARM